MWSKHLPGTEDKITRKKYSLAPRSSVWQRNRTATYIYVTASTAWRHV